MLSDVVAKRLLAMRGSVVMENQERYVVAVDGSAGSFEALERAIDLARTTGANLTLVFVRHAPLPLLGDPYYQRALSKELEHGRAVVDRAAEQANAAGLQVETEILDGPVAEGIVGLARARNATLIVIGSRGRGAVTGALLGSTSEAVAHKADRPVLVVKPRRAACKAA
jgi:nucleotide-binding universal stress UspA family protein